MIVHWQGHSTKKYFQDYNSLFTYLSAISSSESPAAVLAKVYRSWERSLVPSNKLNSLSWTNLQNNHYSCVYTLNIATYHYNFWRHVAHLLITASVPMSRRCTPSSTASLPSSAATTSGASRQVVSPLASVLRCCSSSRDVMSYKCNQYGIGLTI